jgi:hypothetical protein
LALQSQATRLTGRGPGEGALRRDGAVTLYGSVSQYRITPDATNRAHTQATSRPPRAAGFQIELFPLHSPLLRESWLVSFPPLSNMFKFSGSSYLTSALGYSKESSLAGARWSCKLPRREFGSSARSFRRSSASRATPSVVFVRLENESEAGMLGLREFEQQFAFKDLMIHLILQFTLHIAFRGVLHRCGNQEIHR